jgi:membrane-associated phospholipid phosphatase
MALGAHYLSDVLAAMAAGMGWLMLCVTLVEAPPRRPC